MSCYFYFAEHVFSGMAVYWERKFSFPRTVGPMVRTRLWIKFLYIFKSDTVYIIVDSVCQISQMAGISFHPQQDPAKERPRLDVVLDNQYLFLKGTGPDVDPTTLRGHVRLVLTEPTSIKEITLQFRGKAKIPSNSYDFFLISSLQMLITVETGLSPAIRRRTMTRMLSLTMTGLFFKATRNTLIPSTQAVISSPFTSR